MTSEMNDDQPPHDDHEPGDVNGNVDPAWAKQQKIKAKQQGQREQRVQGRESRLPRPPRPPRVPSGSTGEPVAASLESAPVAQNSDGEVFADVSTPPLAQPSIEGQAPGAPRHAGDRRARGMRRSRRGNSPREYSRNSTQENSSFLPGQEAEKNVYQQATENASSPSNMVSTGVEFVQNSDDGLIANPNPGAFGDPSRPMDRSARRNRTRSRNREKSDRAREIRVQRQQAEIGGTPAEGVVAGDGATDIAADRDGERLHKVLAQQGLGSRRAMEAMIESGEVEVNGKPAQVGQVVNESDRVYVKRRKVSIRLGDDNPRILIYHKPAGEIVTRDDPEARDTVFDRLPRPDHGKWIAIGRLDYNTEGLLLFTTSGELANRMMHPRYEIMREYSVRILGELTPEQEDELIDGIELDDGPARVLSLDRIDRDSEGANHWYRITINEGRNREVRRMFEHLGLTVSRLIRTRYGAVNMPSWLKRGQYKLLDENDTFNVLEAVGMRSRKKLEKAARFGGARGKLPQGPVGPMRSATEHEAAWNGSPAAPGLSGARGERRNARNQRGNFGGRSGGTPRGDGFGSSLSLQQQQFPGFGGGAAADSAPSSNRRGAGRGGNRMQRGRGGEVNGNVDPNFRAGRGERGTRARGPRGGLPLDFDEQGNPITAAPRIGEDGQPLQQGSERGARNPRNGRGGGNNGGRNRNRPQGRWRNRAGGVAGDGAIAEGIPVTTEGGASQQSADGTFVGQANENGVNLNGNRGGNPNARNRRGARRGGGRQRGPRAPREAGAGDATAAAAPTVTHSDE